MLPATSHRLVPAGLPDDLPASYDKFLRASVGVQSNGMELSVLSLLARMGKDPWAEAVRLRTLRREAAVNSLAAMIASPHGANLPDAEAAAVARRLADILMPWTRSTPLTMRRLAMMVLGALVGALLAMAIFLIDWPV